MSSRAILIIAVLLSSVSVSANEKIYRRWLPVAYFDGIDNKYSLVGGTLAPGENCDEEAIDVVRKKQRIPLSVTVGCWPWTHKTGSKS